MNSNDFRTAAAVEEQTIDQQKPVKKKTFSIKGQVILGFFTICFLIFGVGAWAATSSLSGAVIAQGLIVINKNVKKVQHRDGGIISQINVQNGDKVKAGDVLLKIDDTQLQSELGIIQSQLTELTARSARLSTEINGFKKINFPVEFSKKSNHAAKVLKAEKRLFEISNAHKERQKEQLGSQIEQLRQEISGIQSQRNSKKSQLKLIKKELIQIKILYRKKLTAINRVYALEREEKRLDGEYGGLVAQIARTNGKISEIKMQILSIDEGARLQAQKDLRSSEARIAELSEREFAAIDRLKRTNLIAPRSGIVHELEVHTIGGVITSAETVLVIVPIEEGVKIEAKIIPTDIDQVYVGRTAKLRFSAFSQQITPELDGKVVQVSADVSTDDVSSQPYYLVRIEIDKKSDIQIDQLKLVPGMPVEIFISTGDRTALSYLTKPITDQLRRAFREE